jgi:myosin heavy subunit
MYQFFASEKKKNLAGKTIVNLGRALSEKYQINTETASDLGVHALTELPDWEQFENFKPVFNSDEKSVSIIFKWTNKPFTLPEGSTKHTLYSDWENVQNKITTHIAHITNIVDENEKKEKTISNVIKHFFLGKQQKFSEYRSDLDKLRKINYGFIEKAELQEKIARINKILSDVIKDAEQIIEEDRKARIQENIEDKNKEKASLKAELSVKEIEASNAKDEYQKLSDSSEEFTKELEKHLETLKKEKKDELARLEKLLADANKSAEDSDTTVKEIEKQIEEVNTGKDSAIADIEQKLNETKETKKNLEELKLKHQRLENDADSFRKKISAKTREIESLEAQLKNTGGGKDEAQKKESVLAGMKKPSGKAAANRTDSPQTLGVPELARLPAKGELYQHKGQDYLAIEYWEEYNEGKEEAGRLKAKLCAKGGK